MAKRGKNKAKGKPQQSAADVTAAAASVVEVASKLPHRKTPWMEPIGFCASTFYGEEEDDDDEDELELEPWPPFANATRPLSVPLDPDPVVAPLPPPLRANNSNNNATLSTWQLLNLLDASDTPEDTSTMPHDNEANRSTTVTNRNQMSSAPHHNDFVLPLDNNDSGSSDEEDSND